MVNEFEVEGVVQYVDQEHISILHEGKNQIWLVKGRFNNVKRGDTIKASGYISTCLNITDVEVL